MKKVPVTLLCVSSLGLATWLALSPPGPAPAISAPAPALAARLPAEPKAPAPAPQAPQPDSAAEKLRLSLQKADENAARIHKLLTPERARAIREGSLKKTRQDYEKFVTNLKLGENDTARLMEIVMERENRNLDAMDELNRRGYTEGLKSYAETRKVERSLAEFQLRDLLGQAQYEELASFEKQREAGIIANASRIASKYQDD